MTNFTLGSTFEWNGKIWKIIGFKQEQIAQKAVIQEVNGRIRTTIDLRFLMTLIV